MIDWRFISSNSFMILSKFCELSNLTVYDAINGFKEHIFVSSDLLDERNFLENFQSIINDFIDSTETNFRQTINLIRIFHHVNQPISERRSIGVFSSDDEVSFFNSQLEPIGSASEDFANEIRSENIFGVYDEFFRIFSKVAMIKYPLQNELRYLFPESLNYVTKI